MTVQGLTEQGLSLLHRGKVRDTYQLLHEPDLLMVYATDRISIFDFVLGTKVPRKGEVLTAMTVFWLSQILHEMLVDHLVAFGKDIDQYLPKKLVGNPALRRRALIVHKLNMLPVECIARGYLTGSGWKAYQEDGTVCGISLPAGLTDGDPLPQRIFTPTTKAQSGHDEPLNAADVERQYGNWIGTDTIMVYAVAQEYARERGIIIADTKLEFGSNRMLADEVLTPDSSRFWDLEEYERARLSNRSPSGYDKDLVRNEGRQAQINGRGRVNISKLDPTNSEDVQLVSSWRVPNRIIEETTFRYHTIMRRLTGLGLVEFQSNVMNA